MKIALWHIFSIVALLLISSCESITDEPVLFTQLDSEYTGINFANNLTETDSLIALSFEYLYNGGGIALGDYNNDGLQDVFFTSNMNNSLLYLNKGNMQFEDITTSSGIETKGKWTSGATAVDINKDGWLDIYISVGGLSTDKEKRYNLLYINQKNNTFKEAAKAFGVADAGYSINALFFDYDKDEDLDLYILTTELDPYCWTEFRPRRLNGEAPSTDRLYKNNGNNTFTNVSSEAGILIEGYGLGMGINDFNNDGWMDLYIANDFLSNDVIYINNGDGTFSDKIDQYFDHLSRNSMGTDLQDFNNDGHTDLMVVDMLPKSNARQKSMFGFFNYDKFQLGLQEGYLPQYPRNTLQVNNGNGSFSELGQLAGIDKTDWSWTPLFADFDNDGWQDLFISNGYRQDITNMDFATYSRQLTASPIGTHEAKEQKMFEKLRELPEIKMHNYMYKNPGKFPFEDKSTAWGFDKASYSNGAVYGDLDNDGDLDLIINNIDEKAFIYQNNLYSLESPNIINYLRIKLEESDAKSIGAKVVVTTDSLKQNRVYSPYRGYLSTVESTLHFGLGNSETAEVEIFWPDGNVQALGKLKTNQVVTVAYNPNPSNPKKITEPATKPLFNKVSESLLSAKHTESDFIDFKTQAILPHKHSQASPSLAVGDVNGDGREDIFMGGSFEVPAKLILQNKDGSFKAKEFEYDAQYQDMGALLFDADGDKDLDLYVVSGGTNYQEKTINYKDRLYQNDSSGNFQRNKSALPNIIASGASVAAADYDADGDLDLIVSGRITAGRYPSKSKTYLLRNESLDGSVKFSDQSKALPNNGAIGMVCQALWTDYDADGQQDILLAGEWMPLTFLKNNNGSFLEEKKLDNSNGWWNSVISGDWDKDGDTDYIAGNLGFNTRYKASTKEPVQLYAKDFDKNGRIDPVLTYYIEHENYIAHSRDMLVKQINSMRNRFKTYTQYGATPFDRSFTKAELKDAQHLYCNNFATSYIENLDNGTFTVTDMPMEAQVAPIFGMLNGDFNNDGNPDVMMVGNSYATEISLGQYDACKGIVFLGNGKGAFEAQSIADSGFFVDKDAKALVRLQGQNDQPLYIASRNRASLKAFHTKNIYQYIASETGETHVIIFLKDGSSYKEELPFGSSYLSQSSRTLLITELISQVDFYNGNTKTRTVTK